MKREVARSSAFVLLFVSQAMLAHTSVAELPRLNPRERFLSFLMTIASLPS
jgi:hypothetical protein